MELNLMERELIMAVAVDRIRTVNVYSIVNVEMLNRQWIYSLVTSITVIPLLKLDRTCPAIGIYNFPKLKCKKVVAM